MLPFDQRPWAPNLAKAIIAVTLIAEVVAVFWLRHYNPLDIPEIVALVLILIGVIPPSIYVIRRKPGDPVPTDLTHLRHSPAQTHPRH